MLRSAAIVLNYSVKNIRYDVRQIIIIGIRYFDNDSCPQARDFHELEYGVIKYCNVIGQCLDSKSHRILSGYLESSLLT